MLELAIRDGLVVVRNGIKPRANGSEDLLGAMNASGRPRENAGGPHEVASPAKNVPVQDRPPRAPPGRRERAVGGRRRWAALDQGRPPVALGR